MARRQVQIFINGREVENTIKSITAEKAKLNRELNRMVVGSEEYEKAVKNIGKLDGILKDHRQKLAGVETGWKSVTQGASKFLNASSIASAAGLAGITIGAEAAVEAIRETVTETNNLRREINQATGAVGEELDTITIKAKAIATTFSQTESEVVQSANTLAKEFRISYEDAFAAIETGFLNGANNSNQFLENIKEYSTQFREAGFSAEEFIGISVRAAKEGIFSDKGVDVVKEFGLRIREQTTAAQDALDAAFGKQFTDKLFKGINDGSISTKQALQAVAKEMSNTEVPANRLQAVIADVFGGPGEDAGLRFIQTLQDVGVETENAADSSNKFAAAQRQLLEANTELAYQQNELAKNLFELDNGFNLFWTRLKTVGLFAVNSVVEYFKYLPATWDATLAAGSAFVDNIEALFTGEKVKSVGKAYNEAIVAGYKLIDEQVALGKKLKEEQEKQEQDRQAAEEKKKRREQEAIKTRKQQQQAEAEREAKQLETAQKRLTDIVDKFANERTLAQLDEEDRKLAEIAQKYEEQIKLAQDLEAKGVKSATAQRLELEQLKEDALRAQREAFFQKRLEEDAAQQQEQADADLERFFANAAAKREAQSEIDQALREALLSDRELALQELDAQYQALLGLAQQNGLDTLDLEIAHRKQQREINDRFDKEELDVLVQKQAERAELLQQSFSELGGAISGLLGVIGNESREFIVLQKALTLAQIAIDTAAAISSLTRNSEANPANAVTFGAAGAVQFAAGLIRILANIAKAKQVLTEARQKKHGGWADVRGNEDGQLYHARLIGQPSTGLLDYPHPVLTSSGILANEVGKEYYVSHADLRNPRVLDHVRAIENITSHRQRATGGFASTSPDNNVAPASPNFSSLEKMVAQNNALLSLLLTKGVQANIGNDELLAIQRQTEKLRKASGGRAA